MEDPHKPQNEGFGSTNKSISSSRVPHGLFHQATTANPSEGGKTRQETIFDTPKLNNHHLGCGKPAPHSQAPSPRTHQHPTRGPAKGRWHRPPRGLAEECRGQRRGGAAAVAAALGREPAGEPQPHEIMKCQTNPCIFHSLSGHLPD